MDRSQDWLDQAKRDLQRAEVDIEHAFWEWACFTSQQATEKAVKALLMRRGETVWGHAISPLLQRLGELEVPEDLIDGAQMLDQYYVATRYPNGFAEGKPADYYNERMAQGAVHAARAIIGFCEDRVAAARGSDPRAEGRGASSPG